MKSTGNVTFTKNQAKDDHKNQRGYKLGYEPTEEMPLESGYIVVGAIKKVATDKEENREHYIAEHTRKNGAIIVGSRRLYEQ